MATDFGKRLKAARERAGLTQDQLRLRGGMAQSTLAAAEASGHGSRKTPQLAQACGVDAHWLATGEGSMLGNDPTNHTQPPEGGRPSERPRTGGPVAHGMSLTPVDHLPTLLLGDDMNWNELPAEFEAAMPDDALAPDYPRGLVFGWSTTKAPQAGSVVLVRDAHGRPHVREYRQGDAPGHWEAAYLNRAFKSFTQDNAQIVATATRLIKEMP